MAETNARHDNMLASVLAKEDDTDPALRSHAEILAAALLDTASPDTTDPEDLELLELTEAERRGLPAGFHRPMWYAVWTGPGGWLCSVCWGDNDLTSWPCGPANAGGAELARALGLHAAT